MLFRLTNIPVILGLLDTIYIVYLNNIIVYLNNYEIYTYYIRIVLERLREYELYINLSKYTFYTTSINFLGFIISVNEVLIDKSRIDAIRE